MNVADLILRNSPIFHYFRRPAYFGVMDRVESMLAMDEGDRLLDVGCGTGMSASLARNFYVGIDSFVPYLAFADRRSPPACRFVAMNAFELAFVDEAFDKAVVLNMTHHLDDESVDRLLAQLRRVVTKRLVLMDATPELANRFERFLLRHDRGGFVRNRAQLEPLLTRHFEIEAEETFHNAFHITLQMIFRLAPKPASVG